MLKVSYFGVKQLIQISKLCLASSYDLKKTFFALDLWIILPLKKVFECFLPFIFTGLGVNRCPNQVSSSNWTFFGNSRCYFSPVEFHDGRGYLMLLRLKPKYQIKAKTFLHLYLYWRDGLFWIHLVSRLCYSWIIHMHFHISNVPNKMCSPLHPICQRHNLVVFP